MFTCILVIAANHYFPALIPASYQNPIIFLVIILAITLLGIKTCDDLKDEWGEDDPKMTIDECVGMCIATYMLPFSFLNLFISFA
ncbi:MAG: phosphatidylglycerophosphatase A, partial [Flavobacteriales bacterium]